VALFVERARAKRPTFALNDENAPAVAEICRRLEGLPLAIELAAARIRTSSPRAILIQLADDDLHTGTLSSLDLLSGGPDDLPHRQRALREAVRWSHALLGEEAQALFRRLAVFAGGCTLVAATAVCEGTRETITELVDSGLLHLETSAGEERYRLLEPIRHVARELLLASDELELMRERHTAFYLRLAERTEGAVAEADQATSLNVLDADRENFRGAARRARARRDAEIILRFSAALWRFWWARGDTADARECVDGVLAAASSVSPSVVRRKALHGAGVLAGEVEEYASAQSLLDESLLASRQVADQPGVAEVLSSLGGLAHLRGQYGEARAAGRKPRHLASTRRPVGGREHPRPPRTRRPV
jgi:predicted ATPase